MRMNMPDRWLGQAPDGKKFAGALLAGLLLEIAALVLILPHLAKQPPPAQVQAVVKITIVAPPAPKPPPPAPKPPPPKPVVPPQPVAPPKPLPPPPPRPAARHVLRHVEPQRPLPPQPVQPPAVPAPPASPPLPVISQGQVDMFRLAMRAAVQAVADQVYPNGVQQGGAPVVSFDYRDGVVSDIALMTSCGYARLDAAAMQAVRIAHYPPEPDDFHGQTESVTVTVIFHAAAPTVDGD